MIDIFYWFVDEKSGEDFFVEVKSTKAKGDDYSDHKAWQIAKCNFGDDISFIDIVDEKPLSIMVPIFIKKRLIFRKILDKNT